MLWFYANNATVMYNEEASNLLIVAATAGKLAAVEKSLVHSAEVNWKTLGYTHFRVLVRKGAHISGRPDLGLRSITIPLKKRNVGIIACLFKSGAAMDDKKNEKQQGHRIAVISDNVALVKLMMNTGVSINVHIRLNIGTRLLVKGYVPFGSSMRRIKWR